MCPSPTTYSKFIICSHVFAFGTSQAFERFLLKNNMDVVFIGHRLDGNIFSWSVGVIHTILKIFLTFRRYEVFLGSNCLNASVGLLCRHLRIVDRVIYFSPDYVQRRFQNKLMNRFYHWLDHYCVMKCDITWNSCAFSYPDPMMLAREAEGLSHSWRSKQIQVPDGTDDRESLAINRSGRKIGFIGHLREGMGSLDLFNIFDRVQLTCPDAHLVIIGSGPLEEKVRRLSAKRSNVDFLGHVDDIEVVYKILSECSIGLANYEANSITQYTDPGKIKVYLSLGLPVIVTNVPVIAHEIEERRAGFSVEAGDNEAFAERIVRLLEDDELRCAVKANAIELSQKYRWENVFSRGISFLKELDQR